MISDRVRLVGLVLAMSAVPHVGRYRAQTPAFDRFQRDNSESTRASSFGVVPPTGFEPALPP